MKINSNIIGIAMVIIVSSAMLMTFGKEPITLETTLVFAIILLLGILISVLSENWRTFFKKKEEVKK